MIEVEERCGIDAVVKESEEKLNFTPLRVSGGRKRRSDGSEYFFFVGRRERRQG